MKDILRALVVVLALASQVPLAAETWPTRTVTIVAPGPAGSTSDFFARLMSDGLAKELGRTVIVDNRAGAGTLLGSQFVAQAKPDGHTLLIGAAALTSSPHLYRSITIDPTRDFQAVRLIARFPNVVIVNGDAPVKTVSELINYVRANPGRFNFGSGGMGQNEHLSGELFKLMTGTELVHVPFKSSADAVMAVMRGDALVAFSNMPVALPQVRAGKVRAIAVTSATRSSSLPDLPTLAEAAIAGYDVSTWFGLLAPAGTPPEIIRALDQVAARFLSTPEAKERLRAMGAEPADEGPAAFAKIVSSESAKWGDLIRKANIRPE